MADTDAMRLPRLFTRLHITPTPLAAAEVAAHVAALRAVFATSLSADAAARFAIPAAFEAYLHAAGGDQYDGAVTLWSLAGMVRSTEVWARLRGCDDPDERPADGPWVHFASYGDKHWLFLCCDRAHLEFGNVAEGYDVVPWMDEDELDYNMRGALVDPWGDESPPDARWTFDALLELLADRAAAPAR